MIIPLTMWATCQHYTVRNAHISSPVNPPPQIRKLKAASRARLSPRTSVPGALQSPRFFFVLFVILSCVRLSDWQPQVVADESGPPVLMNRPLIAEPLASARSAASPA